MGDVAFFYNILMPLAHLSYFRRLTDRKDENNTC